MKFFSFENIRRQSGKSGLRPAMREASRCFGGAVDACSIVAPLALEKLPVNPAAVNSRVPLRKDAQEARQILEGIRSQCWTCQALRRKDRRLPCMRIEEQLNEFLNSKISVK